MKQSSVVEMDTVLARSSKLVQCEIDGEFTMMNIDTGKYYALTSVGADIWRLIERPASVRQICDELMARYQVDARRCQDEVVDFAAHMIDEGVVAIPTESN